MSVTFDPEAARRRFADSKVEELVRVAYVDHDSYVQEAREIAIAELASRGVKGDTHPLAIAARRAIAKEKVAEEAQAAKPANLFVLALSFILADLFAIVAALLYSNNGRSRAAAEVWKAFALGWFVRIIALAWFTYPWGE